MPSGDNERVFYADSNGNVQQYWLNPSGQWLVQNPSALAGAVPALAGSPISAIALANYADSERVFWLDANGHVQQRWLDPTGIWHNQDLTNLSGALPAGNGSGLSAIALPSGDNERVFYVDANGDVDQLCLTSAGWVRFNLRSSSGGQTTTIKEGLSGIALPYGDNERVFFAQAYSISGQILAGTAGVSGAAVTLNGATSAGIPVSLSTTTNSYGSYSFSVPGGGIYDVSSSAAGYQLGPPDAAFWGIETNEAANFAATPGVSSTVPFLINRTPPAKEYVYFNGGAVAIENWH